MYQKRNVLTTFAREMRKQPTKAENALWWILRKKQVHGLRFRRQYPIGNYILDFYCPKLRLGIEVDGSTHENDDVYEKDRKKESFLSEKNIKFLRLNDDDILKDKVDIELFLEGYLKNKDS